MAFTVTGGHVGNNGTSASQTVTTNSTTPTASSLFFVGFSLEAIGVVVPTMDVAPTGGSLTYSQVVADGAAVARGWGGTAANYNAAAVYRATVGGSPSAFAVTVDAYNDTSTAWYACCCLDVTGHSSSTPVQSKGNGATVNPSSNSASGSVTLDTTPTNGNLLLVYVGSGADAGGAFGAVTAGSGKTLTAVNNQNQANENGGWFSRVCDGTESATITCADLGDSVGNYNILAIEVAGTAAPPVDLTFSSMFRSPMGAGFRG